MSMMKGGSWLALVAGLLASGAAFGVAYDPGQWNMPVGVTEISRDVYHLHMLIFWVCCGIGVIVFGFMFYSVFAHRRSRHPKPADFHESTSIEIMWTIIPFAILIVMAIPAAGTLIRMEDTRGAELSIKVTGYQWKWHYDYVDQGVQFYSTLHADSNRARQLDSGVDPIRSTPKSHGSCTRRLRVDPPLSKLSPKDGRGQTFSASPPPHFMTRRMPCPDSSLS